MKYELSLVPPGGGEQNYCVTINNATHIPRVGDYIKLIESEVRGVQAYRVLYVTSEAVFTQDGQYREDSIVVQAEFIPHHNQSESHARSIEMYKARGKVAEEYPVSGY
jgi:beta-galactosidase/beta-glucuronidase